MASSNWFSKLLEPFRKPLLIPYKHGNLIVRSSPPNYTRFVMMWRRDPELGKYIETLKNRNERTEIVIVSEPGKTPDPAFSYKARKGQLERTIHIDPQVLRTENTLRLIAQEASQTAQPSHDEAVGISSWNQAKPNWLFKLAFKMLGSTRKYPYKLGNLTVISSAENYWRFIKWLQIEGKKDPQLQENINALARLKSDNVRTEIVISSKWPDESPGVKVSEKKAGKNGLERKYTIRFDPGKLAQSKAILMGDAPAPGVFEHAIAPNNEKSAPHTAYPAPRIAYPMPTQREMSASAARPSPPPQFVHSR